MDYLKYICESEKNLYSYVLEKGKNSIQDEIVISDIQSDIKCELLNDTICEFTSKLILHFNDTMHVKEICKEYINIFRYAYIYSIVLKRCSDTANTISKDEYLEHIIMNISEDLELDSGILFAKAKSLREYGEFIGSCCGLPIIICEDPFEDYDKDGSRFIDELTRYIMKIKYKVDSFIFPNIQDNLKDSNEEYTDGISLHESTYERRKELIGQMLTNNFSDE